MTPLTVAAVAITASSIRARSGQVTVDEIAVTSTRSKIHVAAAIVVPKTIRPILITVAATASTPACVALVC
jgi:hypothetical protein